MKTTGYITVTITGHDGVTLRSMTYGFRDASGPRSDQEALARQDIVAGLREAYQHRDYVQALGRANRGKDSHL